MPEILFKLKSVLKEEIPESPYFKESIVSRSRQQQIILSNLNCSGVNISY